MEHSSSPTICVEDASNNGLVTSTNGVVDLEHCSSSTSQVEHCSIAGVGRDGMKHCSNFIDLCDNTSDDGISTQSDEVIILDRLNSSNSSSVVVLDEHYKSNNNISNVHGPTETFCMRLRGGFESEEDENFTNVDDVSHQ